MGKKKPREIAKKIFPNIESIPIKNIATIVANSETIIIM